MLEAAIALVSLFLGVFLDQVAIAHHDRRKRKRQREAVRKLLAFEIDGNLDKVHAFWSVVEGQGPDKDRPTPELAMAWRISATELPQMSREVYESQLGALPGALADSELERTFRCYTLAGTIANVKRAATQADAEQRRARDEATNSTQAAGLGRVPPYVPRSPLSEQASRLSRAMTEAVTELLDIGNPIQ